MVLACAVIAVAGILFGYDQGVIAGALVVHIASFAFSIGPIVYEIYPHEVRGS